MEAKAREKRLREGRRNKVKREKALHSDYGVQTGAAQMYKGWSISELRTEAVDYGIRDEYPNYKQFGRQRLAEWLYTHHRSSRRYYNEY